MSPAQDSDVEPAATPTSDPADSRRLVGYGLAMLFTVVFVVAALRHFYPVASILVIASLLVAFGLLVGVLAVRERFGSE